jgi:hypothetical protein
MSQIAEDSFALAIVVTAASQTAIASAPPVQSGRALAALA